MKLKAKAIILMSVYLIFEIIYLVLGNGNNDYMNCFSFFSQVFIICGLCLLFRDLINSAMLSCVVGFQVVKIIYNVVWAVDRELALMINNNSYIILIIVVSLIVYLLLKLPGNDRERH